MRRVVVDVGNTRAKWGLGDGATLIAAEAVPPDQPDAWQTIIDRWQLDPATPWTLTGVHPGHRDTLAAWLNERGLPVRTIDHYSQLPLAVKLPQPERVGIDRLLNAVAANARREPGEAVVVVDAGSAVTVDVVDAEGAFRGGAILPGLRLMAQALHDYTALLPLVETRTLPAVPGTSTAEAIQVGVFHAVLGGVERLVHEMGPESPLHVYFTGGDGPRLADAFAGDHTVWPTMTLDGVLRAANHE